MSRSINTFVIPPTSQHTHTIIFLHGRGSDAAEFASELFESQASDDRFLPEIFPGIKWVFPWSAQRSVETEQETMYQCFEIPSVQYPNEHMEMQEPGLRESVEIILDILKTEVEVTKIPTNRIFLAGISQGCATAIQALLCSGVCLAGFVGISGWLPYKDEIHRISTNKDIRALTHLVGGSNDTSTPERALLTPVFLSHSEDDDVVSVTNSEILEEGLLSLGMQVELKRYGDGGYWVNEPRGVDDMVAFIGERI